MSHLNHPHPPSSLLSPKHGHAGGVFVHFFIYQKYNNLDVLVQRPPTLASRRNPSFIIYPRYGYFHV